MKLMKREGKLAFQSPRSAPWTRIWHDPNLLRVNGLITNDYFLDLTLGLRLSLVSGMTVWAGAIQIVTELTHLFTVPAPRGRGISKSLEAGRPRPASGDTLWILCVSSRALS
jgi:hypothetical protein